jgi:putative ABC transport system permease protein
MIVHSLRLGARKIVRYPGISVVTFVTLAAGIAVSATMFAVVYATLIRPFPFADQERLVLVWAKQGDVDKLEVTFDEVEQIRREAKSIESIALYSAANFSIVAKRQGEPMQLTANVVSADFFRTLGIQPFMGRALNAAEHRPGGSVAALVSYDAWRNRFGGDRKILSETLSSPDGPIPIVGVLPRHFDLPAGAEVLFPAELNAGDADSRANRVFTGIAKLRPNATKQQFESELAVVAEHMHKANPAEREKAALFAYPLVDEILGPTKTALRIVFVMGLLVLLIAMFNAASVALAQGISRTAELGVRRSVGGTRASTMARFFFEALVLTSAAAAASILIARLLLAALLRIAPPTTPRLAEVAIGWQAVVFAAVAAVAAALIAAAAQTFRASDAEVMTALRASAKSTSQRGARRLLETLAAAQTAVAIVTLVVAALLTQSFRKYAAIDVGFSTERIITVHLPRGYSMAEDPEKARAFFRTLLERLRHASGVEAAGSVLMRPLELEQGWDFAFTIEGQGVGEQEKNPLANLLSITPGYFDAMRIERLAGRDVTYDDKTGATPVVILGESFARRYFGSAQNAIGKVDSPKPWMTVAGVVRDVRSRSLTTEKLDVYVPYTQTMWSPNYVAVRTRQDPETLLPTIRTLVAELDRETPVSSVRTSAQLVDAKLAQPRLSASIVVVFAITATLLAIIGFYGMLAYVVRERTPEIGVRIAIGAAPPELLRMIVKRAAIVAAFGIAAGVAIAFATDRLWRSYLYGVTGIDAKLLAMLAIGFEIVALIASVIPAIRAANVNAVTALKAE